MCRTAFTIIEVLAVVVLLGLLAGATMWSMAADVQRGQEADAVSRLASADRSIRLASARLGGAWVLEVDVEAHRLHRATADKRRRLGSVELPRGCRIVEVVVPGKGRAESGDAIPTTWARINKGKIPIPYADGRSKTFALRLKSGSQEQDQWMIISGLTGQVTLTHDDREIDNLFAMLTTGRVNAD
jgi:prepilin-type N-terminal cleavage/methylation domain-containing protein